MKIGAYFVVPLHEGTIVRDGGVSFGVVPRSVWSTLVQPDKDNGIPFSLGCFLLQGHGKNILIDTGIGTKNDPDHEAGLSIERTGTLVERLAVLELKPEDIDRVIMTHLHFASAGGLTSATADGSVEPTFPNASVVIQSGEWERAIHSNLRTRDLYSKEDFEPLLWTQRVELVDGDQEIEPGLWLRVTGGHTKMHQIVVIDSENEGAVFWGDLIPSLHHIPLNAVSALDLYPLRSMEQKAEWLARAIDGQWVNFFARDSEIAAALLSGDIRSHSGISYDPLIVHQ